MHLFPRVALAIGSVFAGFGIASCSNPSVGPTEPLPIATNAPAPLTTLESARGHIWTLTQWTSTSGRNRSPGLITFELMDAGKIAGRGPVNRYFGRIDYSGTEIRSWQPIGSTKMGGLPEAMDAEKAFFDDLVTLRTANFEKDRLVLSSPEGVRMEFERTGGVAAPSP